MPLFLATAVVSFYVGYFGAGAGFLFMTLLALFGYEDIHAINALKVVANLLANGIAFVIFIIDGQVVWRFCLAAMVAAAIGGYTSASLARRVPQPVLRGLVVAIGLSMAAWFFVSSELFQLLALASASSFPTRMKAPRVFAPSVLGPESAGSQELEASS